MSEARPQASKEQVVAICMLRETGKTFEQISRAMKLKGLSITASAISWHCLIHGADKPNAKPLKPPPTKSLTIERSGHILRRFTQSEDERLIALESTGISLAEVARQRGRKRNSVLGRLATLARHEERGVTHDGAPA